MSELTIGLLGVAAGLALALLWSRRGELLPWLARAPGWAWLVIAGAAMLVWLRRPSGSSAPPAAAPAAPPPTSSTIPRPEHHAHDIPIETVPAADAPLTPPAAGDAELLRWLEHRASNRSDTAE